MVHAIFDAVVAFRGRRLDLRPALLCGEHAIAEMVNDKWRSFEFSRERGLPFVASLPCIDSEDAGARIGEDCARVFADAGWRGPLNIQCQPAPDGSLRIHEFNARFTGATGARWHLGHDEIGAAIRAFTGHAIAPAFPWVDAPQAALEGLWPRAADRRDVRMLTESGAWTRGPR